MQILNIKPQSKQVANLDEAVLSVPSGAREHMFVEVLSEQQQRHSNKADAAIIATGEDTPVVQGQPVDGGDWHDFLQQVYDGAIEKQGQSNQSDAAPTVGFGDEPVGIVGLPLTADSHWARADIEQAIELLQKEGVTLTEAELNKLAALVDMPKRPGLAQVQQLAEQLEQPLPKGVQQAFAGLLALTDDAQPDLTPALNNKALADAVRGKTPPQYRGEDISDQETLRAWLVENQLLPANTTAEIPHEVVQAFTENDFSLLKSWLAQQSGAPTEQILPIDEVEIGITDEAESVASGAITKEDFIAWLDRQQVPADAREAAIALFEQSQQVLRGSSAPQSEAVQLAFARFVNSLQELLAQPGNVQQLTAALEQMKHQLETMAPTMSLQPIPENKVLQVFAAAAQELKQAVQEVQRTELAHVPMKEGAAPRLTEGVSSIPNMPDANTVSSVSPVLNGPLQQPQAQQALLRPLPTMAAPQPSETLFEQARQQQQYIDLFSPRAATQLKDQMAVMFNNRNQFAEMRLDPPELGRLNIRLQMNGDQQAAVTFIVHSPQAREAVEQAMPRLRDMLQEQGIQLSDANVREENAQQAKERHQQAQQKGRGNGHAGETDSEVDENAPMQQANIAVPEGRIDYYV
ncbi:flagellar hook-length control protein FliK [Aliidiomarina taiwanensis]|nr:flagellar hook-length control protein FliK [Aliidiomarina taiwanensis]